MENYYIFTKQQEISLFLRFLKDKNQHKEFCKRVGGFYCQKYSYDLLKYFFNNYALSVIIFWYCHWDTQISNKFNSELNEYKSKYCPCK